MWGRETREGIEKIEGREKIKGRGKIEGIEKIEGKQRKKVFREDVQVFNKVFKLFNQGALGSCLCKLCHHSNHWPALYAVPGTG